MTNNKSDWVSASDAGRASYCPHYLQLNQSGARVSDEARRARARGEKSHEILNDRAEDTRCFIATHLYGPYDERTVMLRKYRDKVLKKTMFGRMFIILYYQLSPALVRISMKSPVVSKSMSVLVNSITKFIQARDSHD